MMSDMKDLFEHSTESVESGIDPTEYKMEEISVPFFSTECICMICGKASPQTSFLPQILCRECRKRIYKALYPESINGIGGQGGTHL